MGTHQSVEAIKTGGATTKDFLVVQLKGQWKGAGRLEFLAPPSRLAAVRLSRKIPPELCGQVVARCMGAYEKGFVLSGTFVSPCERALWREIVARGVPVVRMSPDPLPSVYAPRAEEGRLFAAGRLLVLSRDIGVPPDRYTAWHDANMALADLACQNGVSLYVCPDPRTNRLQWIFRP